MTTVAPKFTIEKWREFAKNTLVAFFNLRLPSGLIINDCTYHQKPDGARWIGLPAKEYKKQDGTKNWVPLVEVDKAAREKFQRYALEAVDEFRAKDTTADASRPARF